MTLPTELQSLSNIFAQEAEQGSASDSPLLLFSHYRMGSRSYYLFKNMEEVEVAYSNFLINRLDNRTALAVQPATALYKGFFTPQILDDLLTNKKDYVFRLNETNTILQPLDLWEDYQEYRYEYVEIYILPAYDAFKYDIPVTS